MPHPPLHDADAYPRLQLRLYFSDDVWLGPGKADLLELIDQTGSISEAGRRMGMSYKRAWSLVDTLNRMFLAPLVLPERGGAGGGGAVLTETGALVLSRYRKLEETARDSGAGDIAALISARSG